MHARRGLRKRGPGPRGGDGRDVHEHRWRRRLGDFEPNGLAAAFTFNENAGAIVPDLTGNGHDATIQGPFEWLGGTMHQIINGPDDFGFTSIPRGREVDLLLDRDGTLYPVEIKRAATVRMDWARTFAPLRRLGVKVGPGAVVCLAPDAVPLGGDATALPVGCI